MDVVFISSIDPFSAERWFLGELLLQSSDLRYEVVGPSCNVAAGITEEKLCQSLRAKSPTCVCLNVGSELLKSFTIVPLFEACRERGHYIVSYVHEGSAADANIIEALVDSSDQIVVTTASMRLELIAAGADPEAVICLQSAQQPLTKAPIPSRRILVAFEDAQRLTEVVHVLRQAQLPAETDVDFLTLQPISNEELGQLQQRLQSFLGTVRCSLSHAQSLPALRKELHQTQLALLGSDELTLGVQLFISEAQAAGVPVFDLLSKESRYTRWHCPPMVCGPLASRSALLEALYSNETLRKSLLAQQVVTIDMAKAAKGLHDAMQESQSLSQGTSRTPAVGGSPLRVLLQNRPNALTQRGGDTELMERLAEGLRNKGAQVDLDLAASADVTQYDIVHMFNFATPEYTESLARRCVAAGVPFVVSTLLEDRPAYFSQMHAHAEALCGYVADGQRPAHWNSVRAQAAQVRPSAQWDNAFTASHAAALLATGRAEQDALLRSYGSAVRVAIHHMGQNIVPSDDGALCRSLTGMEDYILCVGRLEPRKNQLMLLKALEQSDLPILFVTGGFTYDPVYAEACRGFQRTGKTLFVDRLSTDVLASAYAGARVHALPSWYELPGLVSLEAAACGTQVVVSDQGTIRDYLGDCAHYASPADPASIRRAIYAAYFSEATPALKMRAKEFTWDRTVDETWETYMAIRDQGKGRALPMFVETEAARRVIPSIDGASYQARVAGQYVSALSKFTPEVMASDTEQRDQIYNDADRLLKSGRNEEASSLYRDVIRQWPGQAHRAYRSLGVMALLAQNFAEAQQQFTKALSLQSDDARSLTGLGAALWGLGQREEAYRYYLKAHAASPADISVLCYIVDAAYALQRLSELEGILRRFVQEHPANLDIQYCLAGCYYRQRKFAHASGLLQRILHLDPKHEAALELRERIAGDIGSSEGDQEVESVKGAQTPMNEQRSLTIADRLRIVEEAKSIRNYELVIRLAEDIRKSSTATNDEKAHATVVEAEALACLEDLERSEELFQSVQNCDAIAARAAAGLGVLEAARGNLSESAAYFRRALSIDGQNDIALAGMGLLAMQEERNEEAWGWFQRALEHNCENKRALTSLIDLGYRLNRLSDIEAAISRYLDLHPVDLSLMYARAGCRYAQGKVEAAIGELEKIRIFEPDHKLANELLSRIEVTGPSRVMQ